MSSNFSLISFSKPEKMDQKFVLRLYKLNLMIKVKKSEVIFQVIHKTFSRRIKLLWFNN